MQHKWMAIFELWFYVKDCILYVFYKVENFNYTWFAKYEKRHNDVLKQFIILINFICIYLDVSVSLPKISSLSIKFRYALIAILLLKRTSTKYCIECNAYSDECYPNMNEVNHE